MCVLLGAGSSSGLDGEDEGLDLGRIGDVDGEAGRRSVCGEDPGADGRSIDDQPPLVSVIRTQGRQPVKVQNDCDVLPVWRGAGNDATCDTATGPTAGVDGYRGSALSFDGSDDALTIANTSDFNYTTYEQFSLGLWFRAEDPDLAAYQQIYEEGSGYNGLGIYLDEGVLYTGIWNGQTSLSKDFVSAAVEAQRWHHAP